MTLNPDKLDLIDYAIENFNTKTFADLGGVWLVNGGYSLHALKRMESGILVDVKADGVKAIHPKLETIAADFATRSIAEQIKVDCVFLFDVLLHQVQPNWDYVLRLYRDSARVFLIFNQQWIGTRHTVRLPDLGEDAFYIETTAIKGEGSARDLFTKMYEPFGDGRAFRDIRHVWQWGITKDDLIDEMDFNGFELTYFKNCGQAWELPSFELHAYAFVKR